MGHTIQGLKFKQMRPYLSDMQIVFQDPYGSLNPRMSVGQIVEEGLSIQKTKITPAERHLRVARVLTEVGLDSRAHNRYPHEFSGGQRQRIAIARVMVLEPNFVILDEPTSALDSLAQAQIINLLRELQRMRNLAYLFISHDLRVMRALADDIIVMHAGKIVEAGTTDEVLKTPKSNYTKDLLIAALNLYGSSPA
jgi:microcin C transport system ATP-binding protein